MGVPQRFGGWVSAVTERLRSAKLDTFNSEQQPVHLSGGVYADDPNLLVQSSETVVENNTQLSPGPRAQTTNPDNSRDENGQRAVDNDNDDDDDDEDEENEFIDQDGVKTVRNQNFLFGRKRRLPITHAVPMGAMWVLQLLFCSSFTSWMLLQFILMATQRTPNFLDAFPVFLLIITNIAINIFVIAEVYLFLRGHLKLLAFHRRQYYKLGLSLFAWLVFFITALAGDTKGEATRIDAAEVFAGLGGILLMQMLWIITLTYAFCVRTVSAQREQKQALQSQVISGSEMQISALQSGVDGSRSMWLALLWPFHRPKWPPAVWNRWVLRHDETLSRTSTVVQPVAPESQI